MEEFSQAGWVPIMSPATKSDDNELGNQGGAMIFHKPWLQSATPAVAEGSQGRELPASDLAWKHFRIKGLHLVIATVYLDHSIGNSGVNLDKLMRASTLTDDGKRFLIIAGDFNMEPNEWGQALLDTMGLGIVKAGNDGTCKTSTGRRQLDYLLVSLNLIPFISNMKVVTDVPWQPHAAITFEVDRRPEKVHYQALRKPKPLPYDKDENGRATPWTTTTEDWHKELLKHKTKAEKAIDGTRHDESGTWQHAHSIGTTKQTRAVSILYAQWSMAVEATVIAKHKAINQAGNQKGRGLQPSYK